MNTVWLVRWPQIAGRLSFWLSITGYKRGDRSLNERLYRVYLVLFFAGWGFMVFSLISSYVFQGLSLIAGEAGVPMLAMGIGVLGLLIWLAYDVWRYARQSPLVFSEDDQYLICQTPVKRSAVALAWMLGDWVFSVPLFWAVTVILSFTALESQVQTMEVVEMVPLYLIAGARASLIILPLHFGLTALTYALGCLRLQRDEIRPRLTMAMRSIIVFLAFGLALTISLAGLAGLVRLPWSILLAPLLLPVSAAVSAIFFAPGLALSLALALAGTLLLWRAGNQVNLSRAAQETVQKETLQTARLLGQTELVDEIQRRQALGTDHRPSLTGARPGLRMLVWKDQLQVRRYFHLKNIPPWLFLLSLTTAALLTPVLIVQAFILLLLTDNLAKNMTTRLRADLSRWWLLRSLPFNSTNLLLTEMALPGILATLIGWAAFGIAAAVGGIAVPPAILVPFLVAIAGLSGAADIARKSKTAELMTGSAAPVSETGVLLGFACLGAVALALAYVGEFLALSLAFAMTYYMGKYAAGQLRNIG
jgi:hypothetical protein